MIKEVKHTMRLNEHRVELLLFFSWLAMCVVHAYFGGRNADFVAINGDFQNYNAVRRLLSGQVPFRDFTLYLGYGHASLGSILTVLFGLGSPTLMSSKMAFSFAAIFSFSTICYVLFRAILHQKGRLVPLLLVNANLLLLLANPLPFRGVTAITAEFYVSIASSLSTGNSARYLRAGAMVSYVGLCLVASWVHQKLLSAKQVAGKLGHHDFSAPIIFGVPAGIMVFYSNDYGIAAVVSITAILCVAILVSRKTVSEKIRISLAYMASFAASSVLFGLLITRGSIQSYLASVMGTGGAQSWYFNSPKSFYLWSLDTSIGTSIQAIVTAAYLIILIYKGFTRENCIRYGIPLFFNMTAYAAANEYKLLSGHYLHEVSYAVLYLTLMGEVLACLFKFVPLPPCVWGKKAKGLASCGMALVALSWCVFSLSPLLQSDYIEQAYRGQYIEGLGYFADSNLSDSILSTDEFLTDDDVVFSTYASALEVYRHTFQPSNVDYMIHALGRQAREKYLNSLETTNPNYVATIRQTYNDWEFWVENANWYFYKELIKKYEPVYATAYQLFWKPKDSVEQNKGGEENALTVEQWDDGTIKLTVKAPGVKYGKADVHLKYLVEKKPGMQAPFIINKMVTVSNNSSHDLTNVMYDASYNLAGEADGTTFSSIGVTIVDGVGSIFLVSQPLDATKFSNFEATLGEVFDEGAFKTVIVDRVDAGDATSKIYIANTPIYHQIAKESSKIRVGGKEYSASFAVREDETAIMITAPLPEEALKILSGHTYHATLQIL